MVRCKQEGIEYAARLAFYRDCQRFDLIGVFVSRWFAAFFFRFRFPSGSKMV